jgi:hypothetical protein
VSWSDLKKLERADEYNLAAAAARKDPWAREFFATRQRINEKVLAYLKSAITVGKKEPGRSKKPSRLR